MEYGKVKFAFLAFVLVVSVQARGVPQHSAKAAVDATAKPQTKAVEKVVKASATKHEPASKDHTPATPVKASAAKSKAAEPAKVAKVDKPAEPAKVAKASPPAVKKSNTSAAVVAKKVNASAAVAKKANLLAIKPELKDVSSDKGFFGPPFPADYPDDKRPVVEKHILDKLKGKYLNEVYPKLQGKAEFDRDYVKDENSDSGAWKAQFEYDALRRKLLREKAQERDAQARADKEAGDVDGAQRNADDAGRNADGARKGAEGTVADEPDEPIPEAPSDENLKIIEKRIAEAEIKYEQAKKNFAQCEKELQDAKQELESLKAQQAAMETKLAGETKMWLEAKTAKASKRAERIAAARAAKAQREKAAEEKLQAALKVQRETHEVLAVAKAENQLAQENLQKEKKDVAKIKKELDQATLALQKLRGYKPAPQEPAHKSGAPTFAPLMAVLALFAHWLL